MDVEDIRAARLRKLAAQQSNADAESSVAVSRTESSQVKAAVSENKQTIRRRLNGKSEGSKNNVDDLGSSGTNKRVSKSKLLNTNIDRTESDCQPPGITTERSVTVVKTAPSVGPTPVEKCPVTGVTSALTSDQRTLVKNVRMLDKPNVQEELLKLPTGT